MLNLTRSGQLVDLLIFNYSAMAMHAQAHIHVCMHTMGWKVTAIQILNKHIKEKIECFLQASIKTLQG